MPKLLCLASSITHTASAIAKHIPNVSRKRTAFINTAAEGEDGPKRWLYHDRGALERAGFSLFDYSITSKSSRQIRRDLGSCDVIHVNGGNTFYLLLQAKRCGFAKFVREFVDAGGTYIGSSAGSIIAGPDISISKRLESKMFYRQLRSCVGFQLVNFVALPHWGERTLEKFYLSERMKRAYRGDEKIILLRDNQYLLVRGTEISFLEA
jgi:dipeptidase E